jgi:predicted DNA-binding ribbon-helix-helix protein
VGEGIKRSVTIAGHRTSVSMEAPFWDGLRDIAKARNISVNKLITEIDAGRSPDMGLSSALRVFVLEYYRQP